MIKGYFGNSSALRATKSHGGRSGGGKTNVRILGWSCVAATGQQRDENGWPSLSPLRSAACWAAGSRGQNICQLGSGYCEWIAFVLLGRGWVCVYLLNRKPCKPGIKRKPWWWQEAQLPSDSRCHQQWKRIHGKLSSKGPLFWQRPLASLRNLLRQKTEGSESAFVGFKKP